MAGGGEGITHDRASTGLRVFVAGHGAWWVGGPAPSRRRGLHRRAHGDARAARPPRQARSTTGSRQPTEYVFLVPNGRRILANSSGRPESSTTTAIHATVVHAAHLFRVAKLLYLGSSCIYPASARSRCARSTAVRYLEPPTSVRDRKSRIKLCQAYRRQYGANFISAMPTNLYGEQRTRLASSTSSALIRKFNDAREPARRRSWCGHRQPAAGVPARRRPRRRLPVPDAALRGRAAPQRRHR